MAMATLNGVELRDDIVWDNEFEFTPTTHGQDYTLSGRQVITSFTAQSGDKMIINCRWLSHATLQSIKTLEGSEPLTLIMPDSRVFMVLIESVAKEPVFGYADPEGNELYQVELNLIAV